MNPKMLFQAYWLHNSGDLVPVETIHIAEVIKNPLRFGYPREQIEVIYSELNEPLGHEGKAREQIMIDLIKNHGWIRVRFKPGKDLWVVELSRLTDGIKLLLNRFFCDLNVSGTRPNADIRITELFAGEMIVHHNFSLKEYQQLTIVLEPAV